MVLTIVMALAVLLQPAQPIQANPDTVIDGFEVSQKVTAAGLPSYGFPNPNSGSVTGISILGDERDVKAMVTGGIRRLTVEVYRDAGTLSHSQGTGVRGWSQIQWDGADASSDINPTGLSPLNLIMTDAFVFDLIFADNAAVGVETKMTVYTGSTNRCSSLSRFVTNPPQALMKFPLNQFTQDAGCTSAAASFSDVGAITLLIDGRLKPSADITIGPPSGGAGSAMLGNQVWLDSNGNGTYEPGLGEVGIAGVTLDLYFDLDGDDTYESFVGTETTDANGEYYFLGLVDGSYQVEVTDVNGVLTGLTWVDGPNDGMNNNSQTDPYEAEIISGSNLTADFGYQPTNPGTGTPGYWKNHPDAWPVEEITIGGVTYSKEDAIVLMDHPTKKDKTYTMFQALVAAKLNVLIGNDFSCIGDTILDADAWMTSHPVGSDVTAGGKNSPWREGEPLYLELDAYNNGELCAPHRD